MNDETSFNPFSLSGRRILVTGASSGLGLAIAAEIARRLGLKESTVATRVLRGRTMLAAALEKEGYVHG